MTADLSEHFDHIDAIVLSPLASCCFRNASGSPRKDDDLFWAAIGSGKKALAQLTCRMDALEEEVQRLRELQSEKILFTIADLCKIYNAKTRQLMHGRLNSYGIEPDFVIKTNHLYRPSTIKNDILKNYKSKADRERMLKILEGLVNNLKHDLN